MTWIQVVHDKCPDDPTDTEKRKIKIGSIWQCGTGCKKTYFYLGEDKQGKFLWEPAEPNSAPEYKPVRSNDDPEDEEVAQWRASIEERIGDREFDPAREAHRFGSAIYIMEVARKQAIRANFLERQLAFVQQQREQLELAATQQKRRVRLRDVRCLCTLVAWIRRK